ncbi:MAG: hypothetical protein LC620_04290, partial [Halobacteriales archaeon]|nr:hypothetical protein [Halobacteriales archaeon]
MNEEKEKDRELLSELARSRVVTLREFSTMLNTSTSRASSLARSLRGQGFLKNVKKGVYAVVPLESNPDRFQPDPILSVHAALGPEFVFSHHTALQLHGAEHNAHGTVHVSKPGVRSRRMKVGSVPVHVHGVSASHWESAVSRVKRGTATLQVTTPERTLLDLVGLPPKRQDYEEVVHAYLDLRDKLSMPDLLQESMLWGNRTTLARMGHLLAHHGRKPDDDPFSGKMGEFVALSSPYYFGTQPNNPANRFDSTFNVVYP